MNDPIPEPLEMPRRVLQKLTSQGFQIVEERYSPKKFGNILVVLESQHLQVRLTRDRGQYFINMRNPSDAEWFDEHAVLYVIGAVADAEGLVQQQWASAETVVETFNRHLSAVL